MLQRLLTSEGGRLTQELSKGINDKLIRNFLKKDENETMGSQIIKSPF
jgi:hypothetical protein